MSGPEDAVTALILETFRLNGRVLAVGDALVAETGLTSARWQVLGAIALSPVPLPVAHLARNMGLARQSVQRLANELERDGLVRFGTNPHHQRAKLVLLTARGKAAYDRAMALQGPWAESLIGGLSVRQVEAATRVLRAIRTQLDEGGESDGDA